MIIYDYPWRKSSRGTPVSEADKPLSVLSKKDRDSNEGGCFLSRRLSFFGKAQQIPDDVLGFLWMTEQSCLLVSRDWRELDDHSVRSTVWQRN